MPERLLAETGLTDFTLLREEGLVFFEFEFEFELPLAEAAAFLEALPLAGVVPADERRDLLAERGLVEALLVRICTSRLPMK